MRNAVACAVLFLLFVAAAPKRYVTDHAGVLTSEEAGALERQLRRLEKDGLAQAIIYIDHAVPRKETSLEAYTLRLTNEWGVGHKDRNDGVAIFVFVNDRKMRIEVGWGLEKVLTDDVAKKILDEELTPAFRQGKFAEGLQRAIESIRRALERARAVS